MKIRTALSLLFVAFFCATLANAQGKVDVYFGMGTARDTSTGQSVDLFGTGVFLPTPDLGGVFGTVGGGLMITPHFGVGGEVSFRFRQADYAGLNYRPVFYDFNGIFAPGVGTKRVVPELQGGIGGASIRFYEPGAQTCNSFTCTNLVGSSNHFQVHAGAGLRLYATKNIFVRPTFDFHWVHNFNEFGKNYVPEYSLAVGYTF